MLGDDDGMPALIESDDDDDDNDGTMPAQIESVDDDDERMPALIVTSLQYLFYYNETATTEFRCCCSGIAMYCAPAPKRGI